MDFATAVGKGTIPIAVNKDYAVTPGTTVYIGFNPDPEDNGGWFAKDPDGANAKTFKDYIDNASCPPSILAIPSTWKTVMSRRPWST